MFAWCYDDHVKDIMGRRGRGGTLRGRSRPMRKFVPVTVRTSESLNKFFLARALAR